MSDFSPSPRPTREQVAQSIAARIDWTPTVLAGGDPRVSIAEQVLRLAEHEARAEVERKVAVDVRMERPPAPDWGGEEDDNGVQLYHHAWDSTDGDLRLWVGPYAAGDSGPWWAVTVQAPGIDVTMRCAPDEVVEWAEMVKETVTDGPALAARTPQPAEPIDLAGWSTTVTLPLANGTPPAVVVPAGWVTIPDAAPLPAVPDGDAADRIAAPASTCFHGRPLGLECGSCRAEDVPQRRDEIMLTAEWRKLIHNVHKVGDGWHWRCGVAEHRTEECQYDQRTDSREAMIAESLWHLQRYHGIVVAPSSRVPSGEDVPARLDAAADAIDEYDPYSCAGGNLRSIAESLRLNPPELRAAVAAALARPTGGEQ